MSNTIQIGLLGINRALGQFQSAAQKIATPTEAGNLVENIIDLNAAARSYEANLAVIKASDDLARVTINLLIK